MRYMKLRCLFLCSILCYSYISMQAQKRQTIICNLNCDHMDDTVGIPVPPTDKLVLYLDSIKHFMGFLQNTTIEKCDKEGAESYFCLKAHTIIVDRNFYEGLFTTEKEKRAILIFVIGHELYHCYRGDETFASTDNLYTNYMRELMCDEMAGYILGTLSDIDIDEIDHLVQPVFCAESSTHPAVKYRILAVKGGWIKAKTNELGSGEITSAGKYKYIKIKYDDEFETDIMQLNDRNTTTGMGEVLYNNGTNLKILEAGNNLMPDGNLIEFNTNQNMHHYIYLGGRKNGLFSGQGTMAWDSGGYFRGTFDRNRPAKGYYLFKDSSSYEGYYKDGEMSGQGTMIYKRTGQVYVGEWAHDKRNGAGILYADDKIILKGLWYDDQFCPECKTPDTR